ncbi:hypothetical protein AB7849_19330 [Rhodanobacter sp. 115]|uniref:hypothetical protein n=1 Tax=Rhodanobacter sp. FW021-MT20 TaxID=1162282 RepID=UPI0034E59F7E
MSEDRANYSHAAPDASKAAAAQACAGFIQLVFFDDRSNEALILGGAGFLTSDEWEAAWAAVPGFNGHSAFMADKMDANRDILTDRTVSAETCTKLLGAPIDVLINRARKRERKN